MGPEAAKSFRGHELVRTAGRDLGRAKQEIDYGRRQKGYILGAVTPADGAALTAPYDGRTTRNFRDFLEQVKNWLPTEPHKVYVILDNLNVHRATDIQLFALANPRWEFVFQPKYAAYLNLIEPWWKTLRSLAFKGRRFNDWAEMADAAQAATAYWNEHRYPYRWGHRRRRPAHRPSGIALFPCVA